MNGYETIEAIRKELSEAKLQATHGNRLVANLCMLEVKQLITKHFESARRPNYNFPKGWS